MLAATTTSGRADNVGAGTWVRVLLPESEPCYRSLESGSGEPGPGPEERVEMSPGSHLTWRHHSPSRSWVASVKTEWDWRSVFHQYIMIRLHWAIKNETILCSSSFFLTKCILGYKCCSFFRLQSWGEVSVWEQSFVLWEALVQTCFT